MPKEQVFFIIISTFNCSAYRIIISDTVKTFLLQNKLGKYNKEEMKRQQEEKAQEDAMEESLARACKVGDRCEIRIPNQPKRRGTIMYIGKPKTCL